MNTDRVRRFFVTAALPYANGDLHAGHLMEYVQADIWVRAQRMQGNSVQFVCADDAHGAPIMIAAETAEMKPEEYVAMVTRGRKSFLDGFSIEFDNWHTTHSAENRDLAREIYLSLKSRGLIFTQEVSQFFDPVKGMFLPDRFIKGTCPKCRAIDQYGDACEICGAVYAPIDLLEPRSVLTGAVPEVRSSEHHFFRLSEAKVADFLRHWTENGSLQPEILNKTKEWFLSGLRDWDISRDAPYFGIEIPDAPNKYFYVWLDAPIGYLASLKNHFTKGQARDHKYPDSRVQEDFESFINSNEMEQVHFIGKDITYFHTLFWPAMLHFSGRKVPSRIHVHGHLTINGEKMSKSRGNGMDPMRYLAAKIDSDCLRYYLAAKLSSKIEDIDFNTNDFLLRINSDLIGKFVNIASRSAGFIAKYFDCRLCACDGDAADLLVQLRAHVRQTADCFARLEYSKLIRETMGMADLVNAFYDGRKPWLLAKDPAHHHVLHIVCSFCIEAFRLLTIVLRPIVPRLAERAEEFMQIGPLNFESAEQCLGQGHSIRPYQHLLGRVTAEQLDQALPASR